MAENKKSFILYCDILHTVSHLTDKQAGALFKHILGYVNDKNPETNDVVINLAFEPIKQQLKRDLKEWEQTRNERSEAGRVGGLRSGETRRKQAEAKRSTASKNEANEAVTATVTVNVNDTVTDKREREAPTNFNLELPEVKINAAIEYLSITKHADVTKEMIISIWTLFKQKFFAGRKKYLDEADIFRHFFETLKFEKINGTNRQPNRTGVKTGNSKSAGANQLLESLRKDYHGS